MNFPLQFRTTYWQLLGHLQSQHASRPFNILHVLEDLSIDPKQVVGRLILHQLYHRQLIAPVMEDPGFPKHIVYLTQEGQETRQISALAHA